MIKKHALLTDDKKNIKINPAGPEPDLIAKAGKIILNNEVVIFPTQCLYGVAANALNPKAIEKVFHLKKRPLANPILILIPDTALLPDLVTFVPGRAKNLMDAFWPGNLTLILNARNLLPDLLTAGTGKIGIRIPAHPVAKALTEHVGFPITGTSANLSGLDGCSRIDQLDPSIIDQADLVLDAGTLKGGTGSTIVDITGSTLRILRQGEIPANRINEVLAG